MRLTLVAEMLPDNVIDRVNGTYSCGNDQIQNKLLKGEFGFRGCETSVILAGDWSKCCIDVLSDFLANRATEDAVDGLEVRVYSILPTSNYDISSRCPCPATRLK